MNKNSSTTTSVSKRSTGGTPQKPDRAARTAKLATGIAIQGFLYYFGWVISGITPQTMDQRVFLYVWSNAVSLAGGGAAHAWFKAGRR